MTARAIVICCDLRSPLINQANLIFISLRLGHQIGWSDFAEIFCKIWPYVIISFNKIFFAIGILQRFKLCAHETEVVETDESSKFKFDWNLWLRVKMLCNKKTRTFHLKLKIGLLLKNPGKCHFLIPIKSSRSVLFFFSFGCVTQSKS